MHVVFMIGVQLAPVGFTGAMLVVGTKFGMIDETDFCERSGYWTLTLMCDGKKGLFEEDTNVVIVVVVLTSFSWACKGNGGATAITGAIVIMEFDDWTIGALVFVNRGQIF